MADVTDSARVHELVTAATAGDRAAFERLLETEQRAAYRAALAIARSPEDAQDALQEAALRAWLNLPRLRSPEAWPGWFRRVAVRAALDQVRHANRGRVAEIGEASERTASDPEPGMVDRLTILAAVAKLSPEDRALVGLRFGADREVPDIADALGIRLGTAKARLHRALARVRAELGEPDER